MLLVGAKSMAAMRGCGAGPVGRAVHDPRPVVKGLFQSEMDRAAGRWLYGDAAERRPTKLLSSGPRLASRIRLTTSSNVTSGCQPNSALAREVS
jgi:hypothetical protein